MSDENERLQRWGVWLPKKLLARWRQVANQRGMTAPKLLTLVMTRVLDGAQAEVGLDEKSAKATKGRLFITLTLAEHRAVKAAAKQEGHSLAGWVAAVIRARLVKRAIYTRAELDALAGDNATGCDRAQPQQRGARTAQAGVVAGDDGAASAQATCRSDR